MNQESKEPAGTAASRRDMLQDAVAAIERLQSRLEAAEGSRHEPIAIVGMACRMPGGVVTPDEYWQLLADGRDAVTEVPADRWNVEDFYDPTGAKPGTARTKAGGFLTDVAGFEPAFFGMSPREALALDPQQRLLLETAWEAFEHGAIPLDQLAGSLTGVFVGITGNDYSRRIDIRDPARNDIYLATGTALNAAAGRVSFTFDLRGPCMAIDTACSSSLVAIHTACQSLRDGESDVALAGGVNLILEPDPMVLISSWNMLSPDGRCKTFDAAADGFVRAEGCALLVLERLSDAVANGRRVLAVIAGSAINQDGRSSGLTVPNGLAQQEVIRCALAAARLQPSDVSYGEAHGTGTSLGDPIEVEALAAVYGEGRPADRPLELGSVKSNIGHTEAASGAASLIKLVLAAQHQQIPKSLHVKTLSPAIPWSALPVRVSTELHRWEPASGPRIAGVSAFGFSGMNAHLLLREAPPAAIAAAPEPERALQVLPLSARTSASLSALAALYADHLEHQSDDALADVCATAACGRAHMPLRLAIVAADRQAMIARLRAEAAGSGQAARGQASASGRVRVAFLFTGQGSQWSGMGRELDRTEPVFRETLDRCAAVLDPLLGRSLREVMFDDAAGTLHQTAFTQPALFALEVSLAALWRSWGVEPVVVLGHSVGEFAAAVAAGVLSVEDGARLIAARGRLMQALPTGGVMVAIQGDVAVVRREVEARATHVSIAVYNTPDTTVVAGAQAEVDAIVAAVTTAGMRCQPLQVSHAFHSPLMEPIVEEFRRVAAAVTHNAPRVTWLSNLTGAPIDWAEWGSRMGDYWAAHVRQPVQFAASMTALQEARCEVHLEVGPSGTLMALGQQNASSKRPIEWIASMKRNQAGTNQLLDAVARLYARGSSLDWSAFCSRTMRRNLQLPTYPFQRQSYFIPHAPTKASARSAAPARTLLGERISVAGTVAAFERNLSIESPAWLADHGVGGGVVMPMTGFLETALAAGRQVLGDEGGGLGAIRVFEPLVVTADEDRTMQVQLDRRDDGSYRVRIFSREARRIDAAWILHVTATVAPLRAVVQGETPLAEIAAALHREVDVEGLYAEMGSLGANFGPSFRLLRSASDGRGEAIGDVAFAPPDGDADRSFFHPPMLDACTHVAAVATASLFDRDDRQLFIPVAIDHYEWRARPGSSVRVYARVRPAEPPGDTLIADLRIETPEGTPLARLEGISCRRMDRDHFRRQADAQLATWFYETIWQAEPIAGARAAGGGTCLIFDDGLGYGARLADQLRRRGLTALIAATETGPAVDLTVDPEDPADYARAIATASAQGGLASIVCCWPLRVPALDEASVPSAVQRFGTDAVLRLIQSVAGAGLDAPPRIFVVTSGSQMVDGSEDVRVEQAAAAALVRVAATEHPELRVTSIDVDPGAGPEDAALIADEVLAMSAESQVAWRKGARLVARLGHRDHRRRPAVDDAPARLGISTRGTLENLAMAPMARRAPGFGEVEIRIHASGVNFRDVLSALGMYPGELPHLGSDCAGVIVAVGEGVTGVSLGDRVVAMVDGAFATHTTTRADFAAALPAAISFEQAAALPTPYLTAAITLKTLAGIKSGDRVLIHSGAGGVGMAAIGIARQAGAEIFATAGSPRKRDVLRSIGVHHPLDSRSADFADELLRITGGRGVDIVLNSLAGTLLDRSFDCVAQGGIFLEIGKRGLWPPERVAALGRGIRYHVVDGSELARDTPAMVGAIFAEMLRDIESGALPWLPTTVFTLERAVDAFRYMAQAKHIGRVVLRHRVDAAPLDPVVRGDATYLITGGLRGLGLRTAEWLARQGARALVLTGRREPDAGAIEAIAGMEGLGARVRIVTADIGSADGVARVFDALTGDMPRLGGLVHCAGVLDDGMIAGQSPSRFAAVMRPKADGAWRLHLALERGGHRPDFFVLFSSLSAVFGSAGQSNYVAANAVLDAIAERRRAAALPATSVNWGAWRDEGMAARGDTLARASAQGIGSISVAEGLRAFESLVRDRVTRAAVAPIDWRAVRAQFTAVPPLIAALVASAAPDGDTGVRVATAAAADFAAMSGAERLARLEAFVRHELGTVLALGDGANDVPADAPFTTIGLDSLTAVELRNRLQAALGRNVPAQAAFDWPTIEQLTFQLNLLFAEAADGPVKPQPRSTEPREEFTL